MRSGHAALVALASLGFAAPAQASTYTWTSFYEEGQPVLSASVTGAADDTVVAEWRRCAPGAAACEALPPGEHPIDPKWRFLRLGETAPGTAFEAVYETGGARTTVRTPAWTGRVAAATAPALEGEHVVGATIRRIPATWTGGWAPGLGTANGDGVGWIVACATADGGQCFALGYDSVVLEPRWAGWYLFAFEHRFGTGWSDQVPASTHDGMSAPLSPPPSFPHEIAALSIPVSGARATSAAAGPIRTAPSQAPPVVTVAAPAARAPTAVIRSRALRRNGRLVVGHVSCERRCTVRVTVSGGGGRTWRRTLSVTGRKALTVPVRHGRLAIRVIVDGKLVSQRRVRAR